MSAPRSRFAYHFALTLTVPLVSLFGCGGTESPTDAAEPVAPIATTLSVSPPSLAFSSLAETAQLTAEVRDQNGSAMNAASVVWETSAPSVATVSSAGVVQSVASGPATITATSGSATGTASVAVQQVAGSIALSTTSLELAGPTDTGAVTAVVTDARGSEIADPDLTWSSDDEGVATVSDEGLVTAVASGDATITVEATSGGQSVTGTLTATVDDAAPAGPSGGEVSLAAAAVSLVLPPGALSESVFLTADPAVDLPADPTPIPGTAFDFGPDGIVFDEPVTLTIDYDPAELPAGASEQKLGLYKLVDDEYVLVDGSIVDVSSGSVSGTIGGFSIYAILLPEMLDRDEAIAAARVAYVDEAATANYLVASMGPQPFPEGTRFEEYHGPDHPVIETVLERESYFALVDRLPAAGLPHPFAYLFIDGETGEVTVEEAWYPPLVDGVPTYMTYEERVDPSERFEPVDLDGPHAPALEGIYEFEEDVFSGPAAVGGLASPPARQPGADGPKRIAIGIAGGRDSWQENSVNVFADRMRNQGFESQTYFSKDHSLAELRQLIAERTAGLGEGDKVVLYMHMHAWVDDENGDGVLDRAPGRLAYDLGGENEEAWPVFSTDNGSVPDLLDDIPAESVNVIIQSCGAAGALVNWMPRPAKGAPFQAHPGSTVRVYAASAVDRVCRNSRTPTTPNFLMSNYLSVFLDHFSTDPLDADGSGDLTLDEIESGFGAAHQHATNTFAEGDVFDFDQKPPPVAAFGGGTLQIDAPGDGAVFPLGETIVLQGQGTDPTKGSLIFGDFTWESDVDGVLGIGSVIGRNDLSPGEHVITLTGTFSGGVTVTRTVKITVGVGGVPQISLTSPTGGTYRRGEDAIEFSATATDPEDGDLDSLQDIIWTSNIDGDFGTGESFQRSHMSPGIHTITVDARDSAGNIARVMFEITVLFPAGASLTGTLTSHTGPFSWAPTISNPGPIELVTEVVDGVMFLTIKSDADLRGEYDPQTGEWMATGETIFPGEGTLRETYEGMWEEKDGKWVFTGILTYEFTPEDGSEPGTATYAVTLTAL